MLPAFLTQKFLTGVVRAYPTTAFIGDSILPLQPVPGMETMWDIIMEDAELAPFVAIDAESNWPTRLVYSAVLPSLPILDKKKCSTKPTCFPCAWPVTLT